jgi:ubiquinone biosynthesis protein
VSRDVLARRLLASFLGQVLHDGLYHADPHPGNLFVDVHGTLWFLDFGSVGRLDPVSLEGLQGLAIAFSLQDANLLARAVSHLAGDDGATDLRSLEGDLGVILGDVNAGGGIDPQVVMQVLAVMERHGLHTPRSISLLSRALLTLEGTLKMLDPTFDLAVEGERVVSRDRKDVIDSPQEMVKRELLRALPSLRTLPGNVEALTNQLRSGRLTVRTESFSGGDRRVVDRWVDRLLVAATGGFGALASAGLLVAAGLTADKGVQDALWLLGFAGLTFSTALLMRSVAQALRRLPPREDDQYSSDE